MYWFFSANTAKLVVVVSFGWKCLLNLSSSKSLLVFWPNLDRADWPVDVKAKQKPQTRQNCLSNPNLQWSSLTKELICLVRRVTSCHQCYKFVQGIRVSTIPKVMAQLQMLYIEWLDQDLVGWIQINLLPQFLVWILGFVANHSLLFFVQFWNDHIETRQIQYHISFMRMYIQKLQ